MNTLAKSTNSRSMRYTCLDVRSPDVNFLRKVMSSSRHDGVAYSRHPCRQSADADIVSAFPLSFSTFLENINILRQTSSTWHRILREFCVLESFQKPVAPAGYKNKQCRKQTSVLSGRTVTAYVPLRSATERERAAFLIPCQGLRGFDSISLLTFNLYNHNRCPVFIHHFFFILQCQMPQVDLIPENILLQHTQSICGKCLSCVCQTGNEWN